MKLRRLDAGVDRQIIIGMVVSDKFLRSVKDIYHPDYMMTQFAKVVADWCLDYFERYGKAPNTHIQNIFDSKIREKSIQEDLIDSIEDFLSSLSSEYERQDKFNVDYLLETTERLFRQRSLKYLAEDIDALLDKGDLDEAEAALSEFKRVERPVAQGINPLDDMEAYQRAFEARKEPLFKLPGAYGEMLSPHMVREGFLALLGRAKIGKTWRLMDLADWALRDRCNVAMFQLGDLSQDDYMVRQGVHFGKKSNDPRYCGELLVPVLDCEHNQRACCPHNSGSSESVYNGEGELDLSLVGEHIPCTNCSRERDFRGAVWYNKRSRVEPLSWREAWRHTQAWKKRHRAGAFKLQCYPNKTATTGMIERQLDLWEEYDGFIPDVIILDYPDIMAAEDGTRGFDPRHQENERWQALRRLCQKRHVLLIVVTQSNRGGLEGDLTLENISEDKRKLDHVTALFMLNQSPEEEERGVIRIAPGIVREGKRDSVRHVVVIQSLETGQSYIGSYYLNRKKKERK